MAESSGYGRGLGAADCSEWVVGQGRLDGVRGYLGVPTAYLTTPSSLRLFVTSKYAMCGRSLESSFITTSWPRSAASASTAVSVFQIPPSQMASFTAARSV